MEMNAQARLSRSDKREKADEINGYLKEMEGKMTNLKGSHQLDALKIFTYCKALAETTLSDDLVLTNVIRYKAVLDQIVEDAASEKEVKGNG